MKVRAVWNGRTIRLQGVVTEHMDEVILDLTWLQEQGAVWDFRTGQQTIEGQTHLLLDGVDASICRRLVVQKQVVLPPRSQIGRPDENGLQQFDLTETCSRSRWRFYRI